MRPLRAWLIRLAGFVTARGRARQFDAELQSHLEMHLEDNMRQGMTREEARRQALIALGGAQQAREAYRDRASLPSLESLGRDVRLAVRGLRRSPGLTAAVVLTLTLGIGLTTTAFSVVYGVLLRPLPYPNADRIVTVTSLSPRSDGGRPYESGLTYQDLQAWREGSVTVSHIGLFDGPITATLTGLGVPARLIGADVSAGLFDVLGTPPAMGRAFVADDERFGAEPVVILSHFTWMSRLGGDTEVIGRSLTLDGRPHRIIGVMPPAFTFPSVASGAVTLDSEGRWARAPEIWRPVMAPPPREGMFFEYPPAIALLRPGVSIDQATADGSRLFEATSINGSRVSGVIPAFVGIRLVSLSSSAAAGIAPVLWIFQAGALCVLLIACMNVVNLLLARAARRQPELIVRAALGATRAQLVRYTMTETVLLGAAGGTLGTAVAFGLIRIVQQLPPHVMPRLAEIQFDGAVLAFAGVMSIGAGMSVGIVAALRGIRRPIWEAVASGGSRGAGTTAGRQRPSRALVVAEAAGAMVLLAAAGLLLQSFARLLSVELGVNPDRVLMLRVDLPETSYPTGRTQLAFLTRLLDEYRALPGVDAASAATDGDVIGVRSGGSIESIDGVRPQPPDTTAPGWEQTIYNSMSPYRRVGDGFFQTLGIPVLHGRDFGRRDSGARSTVAIVNEAFARRHFGTTDALGRRIGFFGSREIVGVVRDIRSTPYLEQPHPVVYLPADESVPATSLVLMVRTTGDPLSVVPALRRTLTGMDPDLAAYNVMSMHQFLAHELVTPRFYSLVSSALAASALVLAAIGLYGVLACSVSSRQQEIGVRIALGAEPGTLLAHVLREGVLMTGAGVSLGIAGAIGVSRYLDGLVFGVTPSDPATLAAAAFLFGIVGLVACAVPARRAMRVDPVVALRCE